MAADVQIRFRAEGKQAQSEINQLKKEIAELRQQLGQTQKTADAAGNEVRHLGQQSRQAADGVDKLSDEAREAQIGVTSLGRAVFKTSAAAKRFGGVFLDTHGIIRESNGNFARTRETIDKLGDEARESARDVDLLGDKLARTGKGTTDFSGATARASRGSQILSRALGGAGSVLAEFGIASAAQRIGRFAKGTFAAAGRLELLTTGLENVEGSSEAAQRRLSELDEIARLPGANLDKLIQFSNRMRSIGISTEETDSILKNVGQSVVVLGGNAYTATEALEQISQALQKNTIIMHDFRPIIQRIPGFLQAVADVHGVEPTLDGMRLATERLGGSVKDALLPVLEELGNRFESPPPESYVRSVDELHNSWFLFQATLGEKVLPALAATARGIAGLLDSVREVLSTEVVTQSAEQFAIALDKVNSAASRHQAIEDRVHALRRLEIALKNERAGLSQSSEEYLDLSKLIQTAQTEQDRWNTILEQSPQAAAALESEIAGLNDRFQTLNQRLNQTEGTRTAESLAQTQRQFEEVSTSLSLADKLLSDVESGFQETAAAMDESRDSGRGFVSSIEDFGGVLSEIDTRFLTFHERIAVFQSTLRTLPSNITGVSDALQVVNPFAVQVATHFDTLNLSLRDAETEASAFQSTLSEVVRPIDRYIAGLQATSVSADRAFGSINNVGAAVRDADFRSAEERLRDFDDAFKLSEATLPRVASEIRKFAGQVPPATEAVIEFRRELENLNRTGAVIDLSSVEDALNIQADPLRGAQLGGRDAYTQHLRDNALNIGTELASQAIQTAGELRRIERDRVESLADLEREYSERIIAINEEKRQKLAAIEQQIEAERVRRLQNIEQVFDDAKQAEIEARQEAADRILQIEQKAAEDRERLRERRDERLIALEERRDERIQDLSDGLADRERDRQGEILEITARAADARVAAEQQYADEVQAINNRLVEDVLAVQEDLAEEIESFAEGFAQRQQDRADQIVQITQDAADRRAAANETFVDTMQGIYNGLVTAWDELAEGFTERQADRAQERIEIEQSAAAERIDAYRVYDETVAEISTDLVDAVRGIQDEITQVHTEAAETRIEIESVTLNARQEANTEYAESIAEIESNRDRQIQEQEDRIIEIQQNSIAARLSADQDYVATFQGIQNNLVDNVVDIQRRLNDTLSDLRQDELDTEQDRLKSIAELHEETADRIAEIERGRARTLQDLNQKRQDAIFDAQVRANRRIADINADTGLSESERAERIARVEAELSRRIEDLTRQRNRRIADLGLAERRQREDFARRQAEQEVEIAERTAVRISQIEQQRTEAETQAETGITAAETAAGVTFAEAQQNYVPALNSHEQALLEHAEALNGIAAETATAIAGVNQEIFKITETAFQDAATAAMSLAETLSAVDSAAQQKITDLNASTTGTVAGRQGEIRAAETRTGLTFDEALLNDTPTVDLNTQALNKLNETLATIGASEQTSLSSVTTAGIEDRASTTAQQTAFVTSAGVGIEEARANFVPALSSAAQATLTRNQTMQELDTSFQTAIAEIQASGRVDRQAIDTAIQSAIDQATSQIGQLETQAGTTFAEAAAAFRPELNNLSQAGADRAAALGEIDQTESEGISDVNAQAIADRLSTDASITETRDAFIKARDTEILKHNTAMLQLNLSEAADIREVKETLKTGLVSINDTVSIELAEIREQKTAFDTKMNELITAVNTQANTDVATLNSDTAAMRTHLEALAEEARDDAWKGAIAKIANVGITIAGVAAGTALGNPIAGFAAGQAVGGLVEQGVEELFHYEQTDAIARRQARQAAYRQPRAAPDYLPTPTQLRNAQDIGREVIAGFSEGQRQRDSDAPQRASLPEEINATIVLQFPDGSVQELRNQVVRLDQQGRTL